MPEEKRPFHVLLVRAFRSHSKTAFGRLAPYGITPGQPRILRYLIDHEGCLQREIAADNDLEPATVTNALAVMERLGYVRRESAAGDRRAVKVGITAKGRRAFDRAQAEFAAVEEICFRGFSEKEKSRAMDYLARIYGNLKEGGEGEHV
jgi:MarR family transcriptional regulator, organic hydroperoxide resistance regulator